MKILLVTACSLDTIKILSQKIRNFATVHTLYSSYYDAPISDFSFSLRLDTVDNVPWNDYDGIIVCGGSRITSLVAESASEFKIPLIILHTASQSLWVQSPDEGIIDIPQMLYPASLGIIPLKQIESIQLQLFDQPTLSISGLPITTRYTQYFRTGQCCDLVSVACSEDTSSVTSSDISFPNIHDLVELIQQDQNIHLQRISSLFAEFKWCNKRMMIYRQGRLSLTPCENAEEVFFVYQFFINS
ncbi:MAG: hypothetical protein ACRC9L_05390 [Brevinema sp.]